MSRRAKMAIVMSVDSLIIVFASLISNIYLNSMMPVSRRYMVYALILQWLLYILFGFIFNVFNRINRYTSLNSLIAIFIAITGSSLIELFFFTRLKIDHSNLAQTVITYFITLLGIISSRIVWRAIVEYQVSKKSNSVVSAITRS